LKDIKETYFNDKIDALACSRFWQ